MRHFKFANKLALDIRQHAWPIEGLRDASSQLFAPDVWHDRIYQVLDYESITVYDESDMLAEDST